jgi:putative ABC transport system substrate-binding protein
MSPEAKGPEEFDSAFAAMARERADALLVGGTSTFLAHRTRLAELAVKGRLPTMYSFRESVEAGGLMAYAVNMADFIGRAAVYVDKILKGAKPSPSSSRRSSNWSSTSRLPRRSA